MTDAAAPSSPPAVAAPFTEEDVRLVARRVERVSQALGFPVALEIAPNYGVPSLVARARVPRASGLRPREVGCWVMERPLATREELAKNVHAALAVACAESLLGETPGVLLEPFEYTAPERLEGAVAKLRMVPGVVAEQLAAVPTWTDERDAAQEEAEEADPLGPDHDCAEPPRPPVTLGVPFVGGGAKAVERVEASIDAQVRAD